MSDNHDDADPGKAMREALAAYDKAAETGPVSEAETQRAYSEIHKNLNSLAAKTVTPASQVSSGTKPSSTQSPADRHAAILAATTSMCSSAGIQGTCGVTEHGTGVFGTKCNKCGLHRTNLVD